MGKKSILIWVCPVAARETAQKCRKASTLEAGLCKMCKYCKYCKYCKHCKYRKYCKHCKCWKCCKCCKCCKHCKYWKCWKYCKFSHVEILSFKPRTAKKTTFLQIFLLLCFTVKQNLGICWRKRVSRRNYYPNSIWKQKCLSAGSHSYIGAASAVKSTFCQPFWNPQSF